MTPMQPADPSRLRWLRPTGTPEADFAAVRARLERLVATPQDDEVYAFRTRSIYRVADPALGAVAIKETRFPDRRRQLGATLRRHRVLCEFRVASGLQERGVPTPRVFGAALERRGLGTSRAFLFVHWLDGARTLSDYLVDLGARPPARVVRALARALVDAARQGLVHGRHAPKNLLVLPEEDPPVFRVIDFSHSQLARRRPGRGLVRDTARIGWRLILGKPETAETVSRLFTDVAELGWGEAGAAEWARAEMEGELRHLRRISKRRQRLERSLRTLLRGLPTRV